MRPRPLVRPRLAGAVVLVVFLAGTVPAPVAAAAGLVELPGLTRSAVTVDLDASGAPTVLRLVGAEGEPLTLESWSANGERWRREAVLPVGAAGLGEDAAPALLGWRRAGRASAVVIVPAGAGLAISEVQRQGASLRLQPIETASAVADTVRTLDIDGDGTDELALTALVGSDALLDPQRTAAILRLEDGAFLTAWSSPEPISTVAAIPGDADGVPGDELYLGPEAGGELRRVAWRSGAPAMETTALLLGGPRWAEVVGTLDGAVVVRTPTALVAHRWPREGDGGELARVQLGAQGGVGIAGSGKNAVVVTSRGYLTPQAAVGVYSGALASLGRYGESSAAGLVWDLVLVHAAPLANLERSVFPYIGPIPVGLGTAPGFLANGMLATAGPDGHRVQPASPLLGYSPVGLAGPGGAWMVLRGGPGGPPPGTVALRRAPTDGDGRLVIVPADAVLDPDPVDLASMLSFDGAIRQPTAEARATVRSGPDGFGVDVTAPTGSIVAVVGERFDARAVSDQPWRLRIEPRGTLTAAGGDPGDDDRPFRRWLLVVLPDGTAVAERWNGVFVRQPPSVEVVTGSRGSDGQAALRGRTEPGNRVTVAGTEVSVDVLGEFATTVETGLLPRTVVVRVADPFGRDDRVAVTLPGMVDLGGLPWAVLAAAATLVAGVAMFLRTPRARDRARPRTDEGEVRLEEIEGD